MKTGLILIMLLFITSCASSSKPADKEKIAVKIYDNDADYTLPPDYQDKYYPYETDHHQPNPYVPKFYPYYYY
jgi:hypothetical protein